MIGLRFMAAVPVQIHWSQHERWFLRCLPDLVGLKSVTVLSCSACTKYQPRVHDVEELLDIWHGLQQSAVDSAIDGDWRACLRACIRAKGKHFELSQYANRVSGY